jgi:hypothetical protein
MNTRVALAGLAALTSLALEAAHARADLFELKWATEGFFRTRSVYLTNLAAEPRAFGGVDAETGEQLVLPEIRRTSYLASALRLLPTLSFDTLAALKLQIDAIDDVVWGDNNGVASAPLLSNDVSNQGFLGGPEQASVTIPRAWIEFQVPVGQMRIGRMPSHWGMGLLANGGGTGTWDPTAPEYEKRPSIDYYFDNDFGDKHFGSTADRILFVTKPITVARTIAGDKDSESNFIVGYAYDKITEAPLLPAEGAQRTRRPFGQQGFLSRGKDDDVNEHIFLALYNNPGWDRVRYTDELRLGTYHVLRTARESSTLPSDPDLGDPDANCSSDDAGVEPCKDDGSLVWIADVWWKLRYGPYYTEGEAYAIRGRTFGGIPFPAKNRVKKANITGGVARFGYLTDAWDALLEVGHASGDDRLEDESFKQRALHPDYNPSLILFEEIIREASARTFGPPFFSAENPEGAFGLMSNGGVINANYGSLKGRYRPGIAGLRLIGQVMFAWLDERTTTGASIYPYADELDGSYLGTELDLAVKSAWAGDHLDLSLELGYLKFGEVLETMYPNANDSFSLQTRMAFVW